MKTFKRIWNIFTNALVVLAVVAAALLVGVRLFGLQVFTVLSGSMEPVYHTGSLIYVKKVDPFTLQSGDVITFMMDADTVATHRIVGIVPDEEDPGVIRFRTKGDANSVEDATLVHYANVVGTPVFTIPKLGYAVNYVQNPPGTYVAISVVALLLGMVFLPDIFEEEPEKEKKPGKEKSRRRRKNEPELEPEGEEPEVLPETPAGEEPRPQPEKPLSRRAGKETLKPARKEAPKPAPDKAKASETGPIPKAEPKEEAYDLESILAEFRFDD